MPNPKRTKWIPGPLRKAGLVVLFALLTVVLYVVLNFLLVDDLHSYSRVMLQEYYNQADQVDTIFVGSSHCYRSFDPELVDAALGTHSFNLGTSQQLPDGSYWMVREARDNRQLRQVYLDNLWEMGGAAAFADLLFPARHAIAEPGEMPALWRGKLTDGYEPGNYDWVTYPGEEEYRGRGFVYTYGVSQWGYGTVLDVDADAPLSDFGWEYLTRTTRFCRENGIRLVLVTAPLPSAYVEDTGNYQAYVDAMRAFAAENGTEYWDFSLIADRELLPLGEEDYSDMHHLNGQGAEKFTAAFCEVASRSAVGENVSGLFCTTVEEKLTLAPDGTYCAPDGAASHWEGEGQN